MVSLPGASAENSHVCGPSGTDAPAPAKPWTTVAPTSAHEKLELGCAQPSDSPDPDLQNPCEMINVYVCVKLPSLALTACAAANNNIHGISKLHFLGSLCLLCFQF